MLECKNNALMAPTSCLACCILGSSQGTYLYVCKDCLTQRAEEGTVCFAVHVRSPAIHGYSLNNKLDPLLDTPIDNKLDPLLHTLIDNKLDSV